jgi:hypothetical protein
MEVRSIILITTVLLAVILSVSATYYQTVVLGNFEHYEAAEEESE